MASSNHKFYKAVTSGTLLDPFTWEGPLPWSPIPGNNDTLEEQLIAWLQPLTTVDIVVGALSDDKQTITKIKQWDDVTKADAITQIQSAMGWVDMPALQTYRMRKIRYLEGIVDGVPQRIAVYKDKEKYNADVPDVFAGLQGDPTHFYFFTRGTNYTGDGGQGGPTIYTPHYGGPNDENGYNGDLGGGGGGGAYQVEAGTLAGGDGGDGLVILEWPVPVSTSNSTKALPDAKTTSTTTSATSGVGASSITSTAPTTTSGPVQPSEWLYRYALIISNNAPSNAVISDQMGAGGINWQTSDDLKADFDLWFKPSSGYFNGSPKGGCGKVDIWVGKSLGTGQQGHPGPKDRYPEVNLMGYDKSVTFNNVMHNLLTGKHATNDNHEVGTLMAARFADLQNCTPTVDGDNIPNWFFVMRVKKKA